MHCNIFTTRYESLRFSILMNNIIHDYTVAPQFFHISPSKKPNQQMKPQWTRSQYPLITYPTYYHFTFYLVMKLALPAQAAQDACECPEIIEATTDQIRSMASCCKIKPGEFTFNTIQEPL